jgi:hypothetical protein
MKGRHEKFKAINFSNFLCSGLINIKSKIPINGIKDVYNKIS